MLELPVVDFRLHTIQQFDREVLFLNSTSQSDYADFLLNLYPDIRIQEKVNVNCTGSAGRTKTHTLKETMNKINCLLFTILVSTLLSIGFTATAAEEIPVKNTVTLVDLGADSCVPCKMMAPIIEKLQEEYEGKAAILFIDVWKNPAQGKKFGVQAIPTQIIYDKTGRERYRHVGFLAEEDMKKWLDMLINNMP